MEIANSIFTAIKNNPNIATDIIIVIASGFVFAQIMNIVKFVTKGK